ncbi:MAG: (2Fe-2S)-binding protein [Bacteroidetes bacterium QH_8_67_23]|jgi:bacterioferritin-associated ferredoxin|nr:MAG: (2Fe-2S)-binding protein [Bacteroidetes bacterium QH_9_67_14]PSQ78368.1 MAG: (2Fe-2S)-binding protein [Bacteroidetes bacterium QH_8_67_23]
MPIDRCYCYEVRLARLKRVAEETGARSVVALQEHVEFGKNCRLCHPYVRRMLRTGETAFEEMIRDEDEPAERNRREENRRITP